MPSLSELVRTPERRPDDIGFVYHDWVDRGDDEHDTPIRAMVVESTASLTAYVGLPLDHPLAGQSYDDFRLDVHGGLTYASAGGTPSFPAGWYWYGWDYAHSRDLSKLDITYGTGHPGAHDWTIPEVYAETQDAVHQLRVLTRAAR